MTFNAQSLVRPGRFNLIATYMIDKNVQVAGLQGTRLGGGEEGCRIRASPLDAESARFVVFQWGYGATSRHWVADGGTNMGIGVSFVLRADLYPNSCIRRRFDPPAKLQGRLGGVLVRCRGLPGKQELHEKIIVAHSPLEEAEPTLLDLFWGTLREWVVAPSRRAGVVLLLDANGRVGRGYRCAESHGRANDWVLVGPDGSEVTSPNGKRLVLICEQGGLVLANTWEGAAPTCHTPRSPEDHRVDFVALGAGKTPKHHGCNRPGWRDVLAIHEDRLRSDGTNRLFAERLPMRRYNVPFCARLTKLSLPEWTFLFFRPLCQCIIGMRRWRP